MRFVPCLLLVAALLSGGGAALAGASALPGGPSARLAGGGAVALAGIAQATRGPRSVFVLPLPGPPTVLTPFRAPATRYGPGHRGVDLAGAPGDRVTSAGPGLVVFAAPLAGRGVVAIQHATGLETTYEPVLASVVVGRQVRSGDVIGTLQGGHPTCAPAACLHWGARLQDGTYLDPMSLLTGVRVRLLPWSGRHG